MKGNPNEEIIQYARKLVEEAKRNPEFNLFAREIVFDVKEFDKKAELEKVVEWVKKNIRYVSDAYNVEVIVHPLKFMEMYKKRQPLSGDCDDQATMIASLLEAIGFQTILRGKIYKNRQDGHLIVYVNLDGKWIPVDTTIDVPIGVEIDKFEEGKVYYGGPMRVYFKGQELYSGTNLSDLWQKIVEASKKGEFEDFAKTLSAVIEFIGDKEKREKLLNWMKTMREEERTWQYWFKHPLTWVLLVVVGVIFIQSLTGKRG
jgi:hypothetical protein